MGVYNHLHDLPGSQDRKIARPPRTIGESISPAGLIHGSLTFEDEVYKVHERVGRRMSVLLCPIFCVGGILMIALSSEWVLGIAMLAIVPMIAMPVFAGKRTRRWMAVVQCAAIMIVVSGMTMARFRIDMNAVLNHIIVCRIAPLDECVSMEIDETYWTTLVSNNSVAPAYGALNGSVYHASILLNVGLVFVLATVFAAFRSLILCGTFAFILLSFHVFVRTSVGTHIFYATIAGAIFGISERGRLSVEKAWRATFKQQYRDAAKMNCMNKVIISKSSELNIAWEDLRVAKSGHAEIQRHRATLRTLLGDFIDASDIDFQRKIGSGTFGEVWFGEWSGNAVAVKQLLPKERERSERSKQSVEQVVREFAILFRVHHPHIVRLFGVIWDEGALPALVLEYVPNGTLGQLLYPSALRRSSLRQPLTWHEPMLRIMLNICEALNYLHTQKPHKLLHRDLKPDNIFLTQTFSGKLGDLGEARNQAPKSDDMSRVGSPVYVAPEIIRGNAYDTSVDIYSLGIVLNECDTNKRPYHHCRFAAVSVASDPHFRPLVTNSNASFLSLVSSCWHDDPSQRPSAENVTHFLRAQDVGFEWDRQGLSLSPSG